MGHRAATLLLAAATLATVPSIVPPALAAVTAHVDISFGGQVPIDDDHRLFVSISSRYYDREPYFVDHWAGRFQDPDDLQVFLFLGRRSGATPQAIYDMRHKGMTWFAISQRVHVPLDAFYVKLDGPAYPPYDRAYAQFDKHRGNPKYHCNFTDADMRNLVVLRSMTDYYAIPPGQAMKMRASGRDSRYLMAQEYRHRHEHENVANHGHDKDKNKDKDSDRDHDHGKGNDKKHDDHDHDH